MVFCLGLSLLRNLRSFGCEKVTVIIALEKQLRRRRRNKKEDAQVPHECLRELWHLIDLIIQTYFLFPFALLLYLASVVVDFVLVTFKDPEAAMRACQNPAPIIDGKRANCNLASLGAQKTPPMISQRGAGRFRPAHGPGLTAPPSYHGSSSAYIQQPTCQYSIPYSAYGYTGFSQEGIYPLNYYSLYGGQQISPYYTSGASITPGMFHNFFPLYAQNNPAHGFGAQYPQIVQYPYLPQQYSSTINLSLPSSMPMAATTTGTST
ncbi:RNA-binding protein 38-like [Gossypium australe]|uniref:RNA-binding protein 38-like n=1 Tax=Gossypium australe TaxID=47621 RepID=A0A5B6VZY4_9ROSI|nr:RNA-binding protein 38-like [Gossypium australe]